MDVLLLVVEQDEPAYRRVPRALLNERHFLGISSAQTHEGSLRAARLPGGNEPSRQIDRLRLVEGDDRGQHPHLRRARAHIGDAIQLQHFGVFVIGHDQESEPSSGWSVDEPRLLRRSSAFA